MRPNWALVLCVGANALLAEVAFSGSGSAIVEGAGATCVGTTTLCPALKVKAQTAEGTRGFPLCGLAHLITVETVCAKRKDLYARVNKYGHTYTKWHASNNRDIATAASNSPE